MARPVQVYGIKGTYADGTNLLPIIRTSLASTLSSVGITGVGLPQINIIGFTGTWSPCTTAAVSGASIKLSAYSKIMTLFTNGIAGFDVGIYSDNLSIPITEITMFSDVSGTSGNIRLNCFYEPVGT